MRSLLVLVSPSWSVSNRCSGHEYCSLLSKRWTPGAVFLQKKSKVIAHAFSRVVPMLRTCHIHCDLISAQDKVLPYRRVGSNESFGETVAPIGSPGSFCTLSASYGVHTGHLNIRANCYSLVNYNARSFARPHCLRRPQILNGRWDNVFDASGYSRAPASCGKYSLST